MPEQAYSLTVIIREILKIARVTLIESGTHLPTAILHTMDGMFPIVMPFKNEHQKKALVDHVRDAALEKGAFAVTTVTCARVEDPRTGAVEESLVLTTAIQGGAPYVVTQSYERDAQRRVVGFGEITEGDHAALPGQMMIIPSWGKETRH